MLPTPKINKAYVLLVLNLGLVENEQLLEGTGVSLSSLENFSDIDVSLAIQLVKNMNAFSRITNWPTIFGSQLGASSHGAVGYATLSAATIGMALKTFCEWFKLRCEVYSQNIVQQNESIEINIIDTTGDDAFQTFFFEAFSRALEVLVELLIGQKNTSQLAIHFITKANNSRRNITENFTSMLYFESDSNKIVIPQHIWYQASPLHDQDSFEFNIRQCQQLLQKRALSGGIDMQVRQLIHLHFEQALTDKWFSTKIISQSAICQQLNLTQRTLIRRLKKFDSSYQSILDDERQQLAKSLLANARYTIYQVAEILGYREPANFCRAFKRWTGSNPTEFRKNPL